MRTLVAGFGCQRGCPMAVLGALLDRTLQAHGLDRSQLTGIASLDRKASESGLLALAAALGVPLSTFTTAELAVYEARLSHRSDLSHAHTGCYGVAESSALALAQASRLLVTRQASPQATVALACSEGACP
jgi:cobalt-precorrin 5A hydrolase